MCKIALHYNEYEMRINVKVVPNAKKEKVLIEEGDFKVYLNAPAIDGKANKELIKLLAGHFKTKRGNVRIIVGEKSRVKVVEIDL